MQPLSDRKTLFAQEQSCIMLTFRHLKGAYQHSQRSQVEGITLDWRLNWNQYPHSVLQKATIAFWSRQKLFGRTWNLKQKMITYASLVW